MSSRPLGSSGLSVAPVGLGAMPMSVAGRPSEAESVRVILAALEAGMTLIDTADVYCLDDDDIGHNERLVAKALRAWPQRDQVVVATKGGLERPDGAWTTNGRPEHLRRACERSLRALGVDRIRLYQLHAPDDEVPFTDSVGELARLREEGKIEHVGLSNVSVEEIVAARALVPVVSVQNRCGPLDRRAWAEGVIPYCEQHGIAFLAYSPVNGSRGKARIITEPALSVVSHRRSVSPFQVALAWLLLKSPVIIPIPGASRMQSAIDSAAAMELKLGPRDLTELDSAFPLR